MSTPYTGRDRFIAPVWIEQSRMTWAYNDSEISRQDFRFADGWYYPIHDRDATFDFTRDGLDYIFEVTNADSIPYPPLFTIFEEALNTVISDNTGSNVFEIISTTPQTTSTLDHSGIEFNRTSGTADVWDLSWWEGADQVFGERLMGLETEEGDNFNQADPNSVYSNLGIWDTPVVADDKRRRRDREVIKRTAGKRGFSAGFEDRNIRRFFYYDVDSEFVTSNPLPYNDGVSGNLPPNNRFDEWWEYATESPKDLLVIHNFTDPATPSLDPADHADVEAISPIDVSPFKDTQEAIQDIDAGAKSAVDFEAQIVNDSFSNYGH